MFDLSSMNHNYVLIKIQINSLQRANEMMNEAWGTYTNEPGFKMAEDPNFLKMVGVEQLSAFSAPFNGCAKPFLCEMYKLMNNEMIKELERRLEKLESENNS
jgi:hypothetical protein